MDKIIHVYTMSKCSSVQVSWPILPEIVSVSLLNLAFENSHIVTPDFLKIKFSTEVLVLPDRKNTDDVCVHVDMSAPSCWLLLLAVATSELL